MNTKEEDFITILVSGRTHDSLLFFTDRGKVFEEKLYAISEGKRTTRGKAIVNVLPLEAGERVTSVLVAPKGTKPTAQAIILATARGIMKKVDAAALADIRRNGIIAMALGKGDELRFARFVGPGDRVIMATKKGQSIFFSEKDVRRMGRAAAGVRAIKLVGGDEVVGAGVVPRDASGERALLTMTARGYGKKTAIGHYRLQKRAGSGVKTAAVTRKTGDVIAAQVLGAEHSEVIAMSQKGQVIRTKTSDIPSLGRQTQGVRIMKLKTGDALATLTCF